MWTLGIRWKRNDNCQCVQMFRNLPVQSSNFFSCVEWHGNAHKERSRLYLQAIMIFGREISWFFNYFFQAGWYPAPAKADPGAEEWGPKCEDRSVRTEVWGLHANHTLSERIPLSANKRGLNASMRTLDVPAYGKTGRHPLSFFFFFLL